MPKHSRLEIDLIRLITATRARLPKSVINYMSHSRIDLLSVAIHHSRNLLWLAANTASKSP